MSDFCLVEDRFVMIYRTRLRMEGLKVCLLNYVVNFCHWWGNENQGLENDVSWTAKKSITL